MWRNALKSTYSNAGHRILVRSLLLIRAEAIMFGHVGADELAAAVVGGQGRFIPFRGRAVSTCPRGLDHDRMGWAKGDVVWFIWQGFVIAGWSG